MLDGYHNHNNSIKEKNHTKITGILKSAFNINDELKLQLEFEYNNESKYTPPYKM